jgi:predicted acyl esterase
VNKRRAPLGVLLVLALIMGGFVASGAASASTPAAPSVFRAHGSVGQVYVTGLPGGAQAALLNASGHRVASKAADSLGGLVFYDVKPGTGYRVRQLPSGPKSGPLTVHTAVSAPWNPGIYQQPVAEAGYGYLTTRDGTKLAYTVHPPTSPAGLGINLPPKLVPFTKPWPTLIEYSGYGYADPAGPVSGIAALANLMGFAVVDVNMRGTGCSAGAYNFFEALQNLDGYDVIEAVAAQPWVRGHRVGMMGISFGGISQLFTAQTRPPSLAAIAPLSVLDATPSTLLPGGILNTGFAVNWAQERQHDAEPAGPSSGQPWAYQRIQQGDQVCQQNQALHGEAQDLLATIRANEHYTPSFADSLDPDTFVHKIDVPVFLACQWEDEQTGGHCPMLAQHFTGTSKKWFTFTNGVHTDSLDPATFNRLYDFLELYVARQAPITNAWVTQIASPLIYNEALGVPLTDLVSLPADPIKKLPTYSAALAAFEKLPQVRVLFDNGAGTSPIGRTIPGDPYPAFEQSFASWPIPTTTVGRWYLGANGSLTSTPPAARSVDSYLSNAHALPLTNYASSNVETGGLWGNASQWDWNWQQNPAGTAVSYLTAPLAKNTAVIGAGAVYVWVRSSTPDVDLQATVSEVAPDGHETFVQNGYMRASERKLAAGSHTVFAQPSTLLEPIPSLRAADAQPMPTGKFVQVAIPLYYEGHVYRAGTRIRVTIAAPNGAQPVWSFAETVPAGTANVSIVHSPSMPSSLVLPIVPNVAVPTGIPSCPSLRNQPCRPYQPIVNSPSVRVSSGL